jgi:hypothetical protein
VPDYKLERFHAKEVSYTLPTKSVNKFNSLFNQIEKSGKTYGIQSYGVSMTSLEEVFLKLGKQVFYF